MRATFSLVLAASLIAAPAFADPPDIHVDVPNNAKNMEVNVVEHDIAPGQKVAWHIHHGTEISYVLSGSLNLQIAGGPIRHLVQGEWFQIDRDTPHRASNDGGETVRLLITYLRDKAGPLAIPVAPPAVR
jgi:quercetin dioxygenase-like cupin family protein